MKKKLEDHLIDGIHKNVPVDYYEQGLKNNFWQKLFHRKRFSVIERMLADVKVQNILDLGCHSGTLTNLIAVWTKAQITAMDISPRAIAYAQQTYPRIDFRVGDIQKGLPFDDNSFDLVTCFSALEHLPKVDFVVKEIGRVLKPAGCLVVDIPNENVLWKIAWFLWTKFGRGKVWADVHVHNFNDKVIDRLMIDNHFTIVRRKKILLNIYSVITYRNDSPEKGH